MKKAAAQHHTCPLFRAGDRTLTYPGGWRAQRLVFTGVGDPVSYSTDGEDLILLDRDTVDRLGTIEAVCAHFAAADFPVPPFRVG